MSTLVRPHRDGGLPPELVALLDRLYAAPLWTCSRAELRAVWVDDDSRFDRALARLVRFGYLRWIAAGYRLGPNGVALVTDRWERVGKRRSA